MKSYHADRCRLQPAAEPLVGALTESQAARYLAIAPRTLWALRQSGDGPAFVRIGERCIRYPKAMLDRYLEEKATASLSTSTTKGGVA